MDSTSSVVSSPPASLSVAVPSNVQMHDDHHLEEDGFLAHPVPPPPAVQQYYDYLAYNSEQKECVSKMKRDAVAYLMTLDSRECETASGRLRLVEYEGREKLSLKALTKGLVLSFCRWASQRERPNDVSAQSLASDLWELRPVKVRQRLERDLRGTKRKAETAMLDDEQE